MLKERPILFSTPMVRSIEAEIKDQTRRIIKEQPKAGQQYGKATDIHGNEHWVLGCPGSNEVEIINCPFGKAGDLLWVRETWLNINSIFEQPAYVYKSDNPNWIMASGEHWKPSIHMPKKAARIWLEVIDVRIEQLNSISSTDARREGICIDPETGAKYINYMGGLPTYSERTSFQTLWESINGEKSWKDNPWVWVIEFKVIQKP